MKNKFKGILQRILKDFMKKKNDNWNIRRLVNELFVPSAQQTSVLYCRLTLSCSLQSRSKWTIEQFKPVQQSKQQALRVYCPNVYAVVTILQTSEEPWF